MMTIIVSSPTRLGSTLKHPLQGSSGPAQFFSVSAVCGLVACGRTDGEEAEEDADDDGVSIGRSLSCLCLVTLRVLCAASSSYFTNKPR